MMCTVYVINRDLMAVRRRAKRQRWDASHAACDALPLQALDEMMLLSDRDAVLGTSDEDPGRNACCQGGVSTCVRKTLTAGLMHAFLFCTLRQSAEEPVYVRTA